MSAPAAAPRPSIHTIKAFCAATFRLTVIDLESHRRDATSVQARHLAIWMARHMTGHSLSVIGRQFGDRDHTTVLHAVRRIERLLPDDPGLQATALDLMEAITPRAAA